MFLNPVFERGVDNRITEYITLHIIVMFNDQFLPCLGCVPISRFLGIISYIPLIEVCFLCLHLLWPRCYFLGWQWIGW